MIRVAVLRGGPSPEYDVSLKTGEHVLSLLRDMPEKYKPLDVFISKDGSWHMYGRECLPQRALQHVDVVFNALHGSYGEDGQVQRLLTSLRIPYTGSDSMASAVAMNKDMAKTVYIKHGLRTPNHQVIRSNISMDGLVEIFRNSLHPVVVKPSSGGSSIGMKIAHTFHELKEAVAEGFRYSERVLVEEFIRGKEATCAVVENARGEKLYALMPVEIQKPKNNPFFDYEAKYSGQAIELCPGTFSRKENKRIEAAAKLAHEVLGLRHYSRSDFILSPKGNVYILETNALPGFTKESLLPRSLKATGWESKDFIDHVISLVI